VSPLACSARAVLGARATQDTKGAARLTNAAFQPRREEAAIPFCVQAS